MHVNLRLATDSNIHVKVLLSSIAFVTKGVVFGGDLPFHVHTFSDDTFVTDNELFVKRYFLKIPVTDVVNDPKVSALFSKPNAEIYINPDAIEFCGVLSPLNSKKDKKQLVKINIKTFELICSLDLDIFFSALSQRSDDKIYFLKADISLNEITGVINNGEKNIILSGANILTIKPYDDNTSHLTMKNGSRFIVDRPLSSF